MNFPNFQPKLRHFLSSHHTGVSHFNWILITLIVAFHVQRERILLDYAKSENADYLIKLYSMFPTHFVVGDLELSVTFWVAFSVNRICEYCSR